jgi:hypothetical protein
MSAMPLRQTRRAHPLTAVIHFQLTVQTGKDVDAGASVAAATGAGVELQQPAIPGDGVIVSDGALVLEAADALKVRRRWLPGGIGMCRGLREARVVPREKAIKHALGRGKSAGLGEAQFHDEPILEGAKEPFHTPFIWYEIVRYPEPSAEVTVCRGGMVRPSG